MNVLLVCAECGYQQVNGSEKEFMNKVIMWNHVKKAHVKTAERVFRNYKTVPTDLYTTRAV